MIGPLWWPALVVSGGALLTWFRAPLGILWRPAVGAIEWGHWWGLLCVGLALASPTEASRLLCVLAALLFLSPWCRAETWWSREHRRPLDRWSAWRLRPARPRPVPRSIHYRRGPAELLDLYVPTGRASGDLDLQETAPPVALIVHGGSWRGGDRGQLRHFSEALANAGIIVASMDYRLAPVHPFPAAVDDVLAAIQWLQSAESPVADAASHLVLLGRSAGGHLALLAAYGAPPGQVRGVVSLYGPTDLEWSWNHPTPRRIYDSRRSLRDFLGATLPENPNLYREASPLNRATAASPPTLLLHGGRDELISARQGERLAERLDALGVAHEFRVLPWASHGFEVNPVSASGQITLQLTLDFIQRVTGRGPSGSPPAISRGRGSS